MYEGSSDKHERGESDNNQVNVIKKRIFQLDEKIIGKATRM